MTKNEEKLLEILNRLKYNDLKYMLKDEPKNNKQILETLKILRKEAQKIQPILDELITKYQEKASNDK